MKKGFKILVVDDEAGIRRGIIAILKRNFEAEELEMIEAGNGAQALELCHAHAPDLVITDIRMPGCDGLEFIASLRQNKQSPAVIILSGYEDFGYAQSALRLGVCAYILKPIKKQEFIGTVKTQIEQVCAKKSEESSSVAERRAIWKSAVAIKRELMTALLESEEEETVRRQLGQLRQIGVILEQKLYLCAVLQAGWSKENSDYIGPALENICAEVLQNEGFSYVEMVETGPGQLCFLFSGESRLLLAERVQKALRQLILVLRSYLKIAVCTGVGQVVFGSIALPQSYQSAQKALLAKLFGQAEDICVFDFLPEGTAQQPVDLTPVFACITGETPQKLLRCYTDILGRGLSLAAIDALCAVHKEVHEYMGKRLGAFAAGSGGGLFPRLELYKSEGELRQSLLLFFKEACSRITQKGAAASGRSLFSELVAYTRANAASDINLNYVAARFSRSPGYISSLFKKEAGQSFTEFLTAERMDKAKRMLVDTHIPIADVSRQCGYVNPKHFSSVFKKAVGVSPLAYREQEG